MGRVKLLSTKILQPALIAAAGAKGVDITCLRFIEITSLVDESLAEKLRQLKDSSIPLVFTSENAVAAVAPHMNTHLPHPVFCISGRTLQAVQETFSHARIIATAGDGETLAEKIIDARPARLIFFCGNKRRDTIPAALREASIPTDEMVVYRNRATPEKINERFDAVAFFSPTGVESFFSLNEPEAGTTCFAIGNTTAGALERFTKNRIVTSPQPTQAALLQCVYQNFFIPGTHSP